MKYVCALLFGLLWPVTLHAQEKGFVTFAPDDASLSQYEGLAQAKEYGIVGTLFVPSGLIDTDPNDDDNFYMNWSQVKEFMDAGWEIGSHTVTHPDLMAIKFSNAKREIVDSAAAIEARTGTRPISFASPYGNFEDARGRLLGVIQEEYLYNVRAWDNDCKGRDGENNLEGGDPYNISRLDVGVQPKDQEKCFDSSAKGVCVKIEHAYEAHEWLVLTIHEIVPGEPGDYQISTEWWEEILACAAKARDEGKIEVLTLKDAAARVFER